MSGSKQTSVMIIAAVAASVMVIGAVLYFSSGKSEQKAKATSDGDDDTKATAPAPDKQANAAPEHPSDTKANAKASPTGHTVTTDHTSNQFGADDKSLLGLGTSSPPGVREPTLAPSTDATEDDEHNGAGPGPTEDDLAMKEKLDEFNRLQSLGTKLFKGQKFQQAAEKFSTAILIAEELDLPAAKLETLYNNRGAMYEKAGKMKESLEDCTYVLAMNPTHSKVRKRRARIYKATSRYHDALVELCVVMLADREKLRASIAAQYPDNPQMFQFQMQHAMQQPENQAPEDLEPVMKLVGQSDAETELASRDPSMAKRAPSSNTVHQLLLTYTGYLQIENEVQNLKVKDLDADVSSSPSGRAAMEALRTRGFWKMVKRDYAGSKVDLEAAVDAAKAAGDEVSGVELCAILVWIGFFNHVSYNLDGALESYDEAAKADPTSADVPIRRSGVMIDKGDLDAAGIELDNADKLSPNSDDVLMHRSQYHVLKQDMAAAEADLRACLTARGDHTLAYLRLATILMHSGKIEEADTFAEKARESRPSLSEVYQVKGELALAQQDMTTALQHLDKAHELDKTNPMALVIKGLTIWQQTFDHEKAIAQFEAAIEADELCALAYTRLAEIKLQFITTFEEASSVVALLNTAIGICREKDELQELCMIRGIAQGQTEAAQAIGLTSFHPQG